ncbi:hypothetical protein N7528_008685 [Penicillium herquei]|nr:hypothetical protein N7528_008685 [Penicillium herquei]
MKSNIHHIDDVGASIILSKLRNQSLNPSMVRHYVSEMTAALTRHVLQRPEEGERIAVIIILRSGLAMADQFMDAFENTDDTVAYHLGLFREKESLRPIEYYNKLPAKDPEIKRAYVLDPVVATGGTAIAAIDILKDWGVDHITFFSLLGSKQGLDRVAEVWPEGTDIFVGAIDNVLDEEGYVQPGLGDIGDRLYGTNRAR